MHFSHENRQFASYDPAMQALTKAIQETILALLRTRIEAIDPNWHDCQIKFNDPWKRTEPWFDPMQRHQVKFDTKVRWAQINGPKQGTVDITNLVETLIPEPLLAMLRLVDVYRYPSGCTFDMDNPNHQIEIIPNRTIIDFECPDDSGFVYAIKGDTFLVEHFHPHDEVLTRSHGDEYTMELLLEELAMDEQAFQAIGVRYLPFSEDTKTPEDMLHLRRLHDMKEGEKHRDRVRGVEAARIDKAIARAEADARLTPEKRRLREVMRAFRAEMHAL